MRNKPNVLMIAQYAVNINCRSHLLRHFFYRHINTRISKNVTVIDSI